MSVAESNKTDVVNNPMIDKQVSKSFSSDNLQAITNSDMQDDASVDCAGRHFIADFYGAQQLNDIEVMEMALTKAAQVAGATLLHVHLHTFADGGGITGVALLAESHISVHTWPETNYAAFDAFMCGNAKPEKAVAFLEEVFKPERVEVKEILRG